jgi:hypothetical protein
MMMMMMVVVVVVAAAAVMVVDLTKTKALGLAHWGDGGYGNGLNLVNIGRA